MKIDLSIDDILNESAWKSISHKLRLKNLDQIFINKQKLLNELMAGKNQDRIFTLIEKLNLIETIIQKSFKNELPTE